MRPTQENTLELGLGLAICRELAELLHATLGVESVSKGEGSTFYVDIPVFFASRNPRTTSCPNENINRNIFTWNEKPYGCMRFVLSLQV